MKVLKVVGIVVLVFLAIFSGIYMLGRDLDRVYPESIKAELTDVDGIFDTAMDSAFMAPLFTEGYLTVDDSLVNSALYYLMVTEQDSLDTDQYRINYVYTTFNQDDIYIKAHVDLKSPIKYPTSINLHISVFGEGSTLGGKLESVSIGKLPIPKGLIRFAVKRPEVQSILDVALEEITLDYDALTAEITVDQLDGYFVVNEIKVTEGGIELHGETPMNVASILERQSVPDMYLELADLVVGTIAGETLLSDSDTLSEDGKIVLLGIEEILSESESNGLESIKIAQLAKVYFHLEQMSPENYDEMIEHLDSNGSDAIMLIVELIRDIDYKTIMNKALDSIL